MRILILLLFCLNITYVKADEIYNLLKIPNLEIFKLKSKNNIILFIISFVWIKSGMFNALDTIVVWLPTEPSSNIIPFNWCLKERII